jgi:16S rRNA (cytosine1402-N4)-methyltransferase
MSTDDTPVVRKRRPRYPGKNPRRFHEKYKELNPDRYGDAVRKIVESGKTPAGMHRAIMVEEVLLALAPKAGDVAVDATLGFGGHARAILERIQPGGRLIGLDVDSIELPHTEARLRAAGFGAELFTARRTNFAGLPQVLTAEGIAGADVVCADLGVSSMQLDAVERGFSFRGDAPLDMRMDRSQGPTAAERLRDVSEGELADVIYQYGEERHSRRIARALIRAREEGGVSTTGELATIVRRSVPHRGYQRIDPATRTFQALRIWVNSELDGLDAFLQAMVKRLRTGARLVVISFHSLEDRIVKHTFRALEKTGESLRVLTKRPVLPRDDEVGRNPRARSAKLRAIERYA